MVLPTFLAALMPPARFAQLARSGASRTPLRVPDVSAELGPILTGGYTRDLPARVERTKCRPPYEAAMIVTGRAWVIELAASCHRMLRGGWLTCSRACHRAARSMPGFCRLSQRALGRPF